MAHLNKQIFLFLNGLAGKCSVLDAVWIFLAQYAIFIFGLVLVYLLRKDRKLFIRISIATVIAIAAATLFKKLFSFPRPFLEENVKLLIPHIADSSFPSKHAAVSFVLAFGIFLEKKKLGAWLLVLAFFISLSRVVVGVHYPVDIFAGALTAVVIAAITHKFPFLKSKNPL